MVERSYTCRAVLRQCPVSQHIDAHPGLKAWARSHQPQYLREKAERFGPIKGHCSGRSRKYVHVVRHVTISKHKPFSTPTIFSIDHKRWQCRPLFSLDPSQHSETLTHIQNQICHPPKNYPSLAKSAVRASENIYLALALKDLWFLRLANAVADTVTLWMLPIPTPNLTRFSTILTSP
ncbi:hypothetical protein BU24DRAFT_428745 [Aaosphaeria arxii CBS 175.79]|uniref:Uncharacterized protein n=1 Tax=Aaosphaeria arxii CBS 175.79 TaxID=1450172 RepID=A0A6A5X838_9PLEO|nr:uncharacterized protein BU24DRAFT_428745 [Aaosphaeria arxii CBS 175.79]KAF2009205.1 hypothetical protein BU24DRAFT_428745 [Aaosphaeria arxii CBS 175.79]